MADSLAQHPPERSPGWHGAACPWHRAAGRRVLVACDKFRGTLDAREVVDALADGFESRGFEVDRCPMADGGEGTIDVLVATLGLELRTARVTGPLGEPRTARWGIAPATRTAVIELAEAAGLSLVPPAQRTPMRTTTFGVGELLIAAHDAGAVRALLALGGSATCELGAGMAQALGVRFFDEADRVLEASITGATVGRARRVDSSGCRKFANGLIALADVTNPLLGPTGTTSVFAAQKGATAEQVRELEQALRAASAAPIDGAVRLDLRDTLHAGAAGGAGFGVMAFLGGRCEAGSSAITGMLSLADRARGAALVVTGEGCLDASTFGGKVVSAVGGAARSAQRSAVAVVGRLGVCFDVERFVALPGLPVNASNSLAACLSLVERFGEDAAMNATAASLRAAAVAIADTF